MNVRHNRYEIDDTRERIDFVRVHAWLTTAYWSEGVSRERVEKAARGSSLLVGVYDEEGDQVGYLRVVSDQTTFAWVCDVFVDEQHRGWGIARAMVRFALEHPDYQGLRRWILATRDAHPIYASCGFAPLPNPDKWMILQPRT
ncbi:MAG TPA: GNAT family N-acetyltransferase [Chthonomonadaceae bacterium]|nr:GNAT family N-acetyltransferase [Chthonomonadaceae bacterium]